MGSGAGKTRRTQIRMDSVACSFDLHKWKAFASNDAIASKGIFDYYSCSPPPAPYRGDYEKATTELFRDAVAVGAITLPIYGQNGVDDFTFSLEYDGQIHMHLTADPQSDCKLGFSPTRYLKANTKLGDTHVARLLRSITQAISTNKFHP